MQMDFISSYDFSDLRPVLPEGVAQCKGIGWPSWITKCVTLMNESGMDVARDICHSVNIDLVIDNDCMPLDNDRIAVQIIESSVEDEVSSEWLFSMRAWHIRRVFLNGASLYDHDQRHIYKAVVQAMNRRPWRGVQQYESSYERENAASPSKKVLKLSTQSINSMSSVICCKKNCVQPFPCATIHNLRSQFFHEGEQYFKSHRLLDIHRQIHHNSEGNKMIILEGCDVCPKSWYTIMGISRESYYRWKANASSWMHAKHHGNVGMTKPRIHTLQAIATLRQMLEQSADHMPHKTTTLETREKVVSKCLPSSWHWKASLPELNIINAQLGLKKVFASGLIRIWKESFAEYSPKSQGDSFAWCG